MLLIKKSKGDILINDRKTYYESQEYDNLKSWYQIFFIFIRKSKLYLG